MTRLSPAELKARAQDRLEDILHKLAPGGKYAHGGYMVKNPIRGEKTPSMKVWTQGDAAGAWKDFGSPLDCGDIIKLVAYLNGKSLDDFQFARAWLEDFLGLGSNLTEADREAARQARERRKAESATADSRRHFAEERAGATFNSGRQILSGSIAWLYLMHRGIDLRFVEGFAGDLRWTRECEYWPLAEYVEDVNPRTGRPFKRKVKPGPLLPAILTALRDKAGRLRSLHYTFLRPDGAGKAEVEKPKLIWPAAEGLVMRLTNGAGNLSPEEADLAGHVTDLGLSEGMEDGLSGALGVPEARWWGGVSLGNLRHVPVDRPCIGDILIAEQNDWGKPQALAELARAKEQLARGGRLVGGIRPPTGKDINDTLRGQS
ncbi:MAG: toprim domain-containing protein [Pseudomonadota bacterium]